METQWIVTFDKHPEEGGDEAVVKKNGDDARREWVAHAQLKPNGMSGRRELGALRNRAQIRDQFVSPVVI